MHSCTDARRRARAIWRTFADAALAGGVDIIQLRDKGSPGEQRFGPLAPATSSPRSRCSADAARRHDALLAVNDRADIAPGGGRRTCCTSARTTCRYRSPVTSSAPRPLIGRSTHDRDQVSAAAAEPVDYFCVGPCWPTPTKPGRAAPGLALVRAAAERAAGADGSATPAQPSRGSRSAASTSSGCRRCSRRVRTASSWCGRSPQPQTIQAAAAHRLETALTESD